MVDDAASADGRALSRRAVLTGAAGLVGLVATTAAGCSVDNPVTRDDAPAAPAALAPDVAVATRALAEIRAVAAAVEDTATRFPAIRTRLAPLAALHRTHEASLADAVPDRATSTPSPSSSASPSASASPTPYVVPRNRDRAVTALAAREQRLHDRLGVLALQAQSGDFARLLASMGAAVSQRLVGLAA